MNELLLRRRVAASKSLPYDAEVEYLESTGTQYITIPFATAAPAGSFFAVGGHIIPLTANGNYYAFATTGAYRYYSMHRYSEREGNITFATFVGNNASDGGMTFPLNQKSSFELSTTGKTVNGTFTSLARALTTSVPGLYLFKSGVNTPTLYLRLCDLYVKVGDTVIFDGIAVRIGQVGYMYDKVSKQLFGNAGTGDFILGNDVTN